MKRLMTLPPITLPLPRGLDRLSRLTPFGVHSSWFRINFRSAVLEFFSLPPRSVLDRAAFINCLLFRAAPYVVCYFHAAEVRAAHAAKVGAFFEKFSDCKQVCDNDASSAHDVA